MSNDYKCCSKKTSGQNHMANTYDNAWNEEWKKLAEQDMRTLGERTNKIFRHKARMILLMRTPLGKAAMNLDLILSWISYEIPQIVFTQTKFHVRQRRNEYIQRHVARIVSELDKRLAAMGSDGKLKICFQFLTNVCKNVKVWTKVENLLKDNGFVLEWCEKYESGWIKTRSKN